jgi:hypothetical protein
VYAAVFDPASAGGSTLIWRADIATFCLCVCFSQRLQQEK